MLTGLELMFMGLTQSNSGFQHSRFSCLTCGKKRKGAKEKKKNREGGKKEIEKERKEGRRNKERSEAREEGILTKN